MYTRQILCEVAIFLVFFQFYFTMNKTTVYLKKASLQYHSLFLYKENYYLYTLTIFNTTGAENQFFSVFQKTK
jgi:hypothetical protein